MSDEPKPPAEGKPPGTPPLQFSLRALLGATFAFSLLWGTLRWLEVPETTCYVVLGILVASVLAAAGLVVVIAASASDDDGGPSTGW